MSINLAEKYSKKVADRYAVRSLTDAYAGKEYDFSGASTVIVYTVDTVSTVNYSRTGTERFGPIEELGDTKQEMQLTRDRAFTFSIDAGNSEQQFNIKQANACLKRELDEVVTPEIDSYRLSVWSAGAGTEISAPSGGLTKDNIVEQIFTLSATMSNGYVPTVNRALFIPEMTFLKFKLSDVVMGGPSLGEKVVRNGYKGTIDGMDVITVPSVIFPESSLFIIKQRSATCDPMQLRNFRVQKNHMGIDGDVCEGRYIYDSFVLSSRAKGVGACRA